jgi:uncharacterized protein YbcC (UPF0753/DUF2309 family)
MSGSVVEMVNAWVDEAARVVSPVWPLATFIATNGLGGFEDLPFAAAIARAGALFDARGYLPAATSRRFYQEGRITDRDLDHALARVLPPDLPPSLDLGGRRHTTLDLLRTCLLAGPGEQPATPIPAALRDAVQSRLPGVPASLEEAATARVERDLATIGDGWTLADLCARLGLGDLVSAINERVATWCAAFLDEGQAAWAMPGRERGLYACWRDLAPHDHALRLLGIRGAAAAVRSLPETADAALLRLLQQLGIPPALCAGYLARHLAQQPGWAGFIRWRGSARGYRYQQAYPAHLTDYLVLRLCYEALLVDHAARRTWQVAGSLDALAGYGRAYPLEHHARGLLVARALRRQPGQPVPEARPRAAQKWAILAARLHAQEPMEREAIADWLADLATILGLDAAAIQALPTRSFAALQAIYRVAGPDRQGPIWLEALEYHYRHDLVGQLRSRPPVVSSPERPRAQAIFCIDARSEGLRRHLEARGAYETFGFAGFFGVPVHFHPFASGDDAQLCPVLITPTHDIAEVPAPGSAVAVRRLQHWQGRRRALRGLLSGLKGNLLTPFTFVEVTGWAFALPFAGKSLVPRTYARVRDRLAERLAPSVPTVLGIDPGLQPGTRGGLWLDEQVAYAESALRTMGLTTNFARLVLLCGHGAAAENNPYASALDCGACGGNRGGTSARIAASILNKAEVRAALATRGIAIPADTLFLAGEHNTTTDSITVFDTHALPGGHHADLQALQRDLAAAGGALAAERGHRLPGAPDAARVAARGSDWAQVRPEWGLARNAAFICGRRALTAGLDLGCRTFLHSYDYRHDADGSILEGILTAPLVVAEWITMQYYGSTVDPARFGSGNKLLHNVVGKVGVLQGGRGDLQVGLPWQSVAAGDHPYHEPMRLLAVVEAPRARLAALLARNATLRQLLDHGWITLLVCDPDSGAFLRYDPVAGWQPEG